MKKENRANLKNQIIETFKEELEVGKNLEFCTYEELLSKLNRDFLESIKEEKVTHQILGKILSEIATIYGYEYEKLNFRYLIKSRCIKNWEKDKNCIKFYLDNGTVFVYDFNEEHKVNRYYGNLYGEMKELIVCPEWIFNYKDLLPNSFSEILTIGQSLRNENCPKGFINWLRSENLKLNSSVFFKYKYAKENPEFLKGKFAKIILSKLADGYSLNTEMKEYLENTKLIDKMFFDEDMMSLIYDRFFFMSLRNFKEMKDLNFPIDENRGLFKNYEIFSEWRDKRKNEIISKRLKSLNFLNGIEIGDYVIKVPQDINDLQEEGRQQNNCVGYYYNDSIMKGENLIYFLRKKDKPNKSFVTARYNISLNQTVEKRLVNNRGISDETILTIIEKIDSFIQEKLEKGE